MAITPSRKLVDFLKNNLLDLGTLNQMSYDKRVSGEQTQDILVKADYDRDGELDRFYLDKEVLADYSAKMLTLPTNSRGEVIKGDNYKILEEAGVIDEEGKVAPGYKIAIADEEGRALADPANRNQKTYISGGQLLNAATIIQARSRVIPSPEKTEVKTQKFDPAIQEVANTFVEETIKSNFVAADGSYWLQIITEHKNAGKLLELDAAVRSASNGLSLKQIIESGEFNQADIERLNDAICGTNTFGNSSKFIYFSNGVQNWITGFMRGVSSPGKALEYIQKHPLQTAAIGATVVGGIIASCAFPPLGAALALGGLAVAGWRFLANGITALTESDKVKAASAAIESGSGLGDTLVSIQGTGQAIKEVKVLPQLLSKLKEVPDMFKLESFSGLWNHTRTQEGRGVLSRSEVRNQDVDLFTQKEELEELIKLNPNTFMNNLVIEEQGRNVAELASKKEELEKLIRFQVRRNNEEVYLEAVTEQMMPQKEELEELIKLSPNTFMNNLVTEEQGRSVAGLASEKEELEELIRLQVRRNNEEVQVEAVTEQMKPQKEELEKLITFNDENLSPSPQMKGESYTGLYDVSKIQKGSLHSVRNVLDLTIDDLHKVITSKLLPISEQQIKNKILNRFTSRTDRDLAIKVLDRLSQYGNMNSLDCIYGELANLQSVHGSKIYRFGSASLADHLNYLGSKSIFKKYLNMSTLDLSNLSSLKNNGVLLLDDFTLYQLGSNPDFLKVILDNKIKLIYPEGWFQINPFNQADIREIGTTVENLVTQIKDRNLSVEEIKSLINQPVINKLKSISPELESQVHILENQQIDFTQTPTTDKIASQLAPSGIDKGRIENSISQLNKKITDYFEYQSYSKLNQSEIEEIAQAYQQLTLEMLVRDIDVFSSRRLSLVAKQSHNRIQKLASQLSIAPDDIYYLVPKDGKSYGTTTMIFSVTNKISPKQIITDINQIPSSVQAQSMVVILDDVAGSGDSLWAQFQNIRSSSAYNSAQYKGTVVVSPIISTSNAVAQFSNIGNNAYYLPGKVVQTFMKSKYYNSLSSVVKDSIGKLLVSKGYSNNAMNLAFPWMSPDNNNSLFSSIFASAFTLNGMVVKSSSSWSASYLNTNVGVSFEELQNLQKIKFPLK